MSLQSDAIDQLMTALAKAQGQMSHASKDSTNPHFKSRYADLASVWQACREPLALNGLAVTQTLDVAGERQVLITTLGHTSGQWMKSIIALPVQRAGAQEIGSCMSYCRRYALAAMVGVYQDDDDGEAASKPYRQNGTVHVQPSPSQPIAEDQLRYLNMILEELPKTKVYILDKYKISSLEELKKDEYNHVLTVVDTAKKRKEEANGKN